MNGSTWRLGLRVPGTSGWVRIRVDHRPQMYETFRVKINGVVAVVGLLVDPPVVIHTKFDVMTDQVEVVYD